MRALYTLGMSKAADGGQNEFANLCLAGLRHMSHASQRRRTGQCTQRELKNMCRQVGSVALGVVLLRVLLMLISWRGSAAGVSVREHAFETVMQPSVR